MDARTSAPFQWTKHMGFWKLLRVPEPEEMNDQQEVESYTSAAAARHLDAIDNTFVDHALRLLGDAAHSPGAPECALDIGTGPAQIPLKLLRRMGDLTVVGLDRSRTMLEQARRDSIAAGVSDRLLLALADGHLLPFPDSCFSLVLCNSALHHVRSPVGLLREAARVARPGAPLLIRDLRRPSRFLLRFHLWKHGRHYSGLMRTLFDASVRAAYTIEELEAQIRESNLSELVAFRFRGAHIGIQRVPKR
jgi:ubiquinone/menaquinone biosynthesis C-methylase UbiE